MKKDIVYFNNPKIEIILEKWYEEALSAFEKIYGEINPEESFCSLNGVAYITTRDGKQFKLYYAERNDYLKYYKKCFIVSEL